MARDDLNDPLGADAPEPARAARPWGWIAGAGLALVAVSLGAFAWLTSDDMGGEPYAVARITTPPPAPPTPREPEARAGETTGTIGGQRRAMTAEEVEQASGVRVNRPGGAHAPGALIIQIPESAGLKLPPAPDRRLVEKSRHGALPRVGGDGARPADVYARPITGAQSPKAGAPRIALVVGGLGLAAGVTETSIERLPGAVTLGFAPYGGELPRQAARAREAGHEIMLQAPMEPFDYPKVDPGPHTLRVGVDASANIDDLHWLMSRFPGYVGIANFLGARLLGDEGALTPILREIADRGLIYLDDGASGQSVAGALSSKLDLQGARVDVVLDTPDAKSMEAALARLEQIARDKGVAIGMASALPQTVERLILFTRVAEARGFALIPLSAATARGAAPTAGRMR